VFNFITFNFHTLKKKKRSNGCLGSSPNMHASFMVVWAMAQMVTHLLRGNLGQMTTHLFFGSPFPHPSSPPLSHVVYLFLFTI